MIAASIRDVPYRGDDDQVDPAILLGCVAGHIAGSASGVYLAGNRKDVKGSMIFTLLGAAAGEVIGVGFFSLVVANAAGDDGAILPALTLYSLGATIGATVGFNLSRKYVPSASSGHALVNSGEGRFRLEMPTVSVRPGQGQRGRLVPRLSMRLTF